MQDCTGQEGHDECLKGSGGEEGASVARASSTSGGPRRSRTYRLEADVGHPRRWRRAGAAAGAVVMIGSVGGALAASLGGEAGAEVALANSPTKIVTTSSLSVASVSSAADAAIVDVNTTLADGAGTAAGTGMVLTSSGYILTNNHVVEDAVSIKVTIPGRGAYSASVVGTDVAKDIAVLKVTGVSGLTTVRFATGSTTVGSAVVAIGNALGKGGTPSVTSGSVVALGQQITAEDDAGTETLTGLVETNASLQPGDSGGPLLDAEGEVVGMDTAAESTMADQPSTVSYAIPTSTLVSVAQEIISGKGGSGIIIGNTAFLGVAATSVSAFGGFASPYSTTSDSGVLIEQVVSGSPAAKAGIVAGEEIVAFDGVTVTSNTQLKELIEAKRPGTKVTVTVATTNGTKSYTATLAVGPVA